jgi:SAM-dependent methyltransferase
MLPWDHNAYYHRLLVRQVPPGAGRVLEVGCGGGALASRLAARVGQVDALDQDPAMIDTARAVVPGNVRCVLADVMTSPLAPESYDAIVSSAVLHHLPLALALSRLADALRPGGVLAAIDLPKRDLPRDLPVELAATTWHHLLGVALASTRYRWRGELRHTHPHKIMPVRPPELTLRQVRDLASGVLPGVRLRRLVLWRYLLVWRKPALGTG